MKNLNINKPLFIFAIISFSLMILFGITMRIPAGNSDTIKLQNMQKQIDELSEQVEYLTETINDISSQYNIDNSISTEPITYDIQPTLDVLEEPTDIIENIKPTNVSEITETLTEETPTESTTKEAALETSTEIFLNTTCETTDDILIINTNITEKCGLSAEQLNKLIDELVIKTYKKKDSKFINQGESLIKLESEYNINALFALSVSSLETGWGCAGVALKNNLFGFTVKNGSYGAYDSLEMSILDFGRVMRTKYFDNGYILFDDISKKYCPLNSDKWSSDVQWILNKYYSTAELIFN